MKPSRGMIPAEVVVSLFALSYAWLGGIAWPGEPGALFRLIYAKEGALGNVVWAFGLGLPAAFLVFFSLHEWWCWQRCRWTVFQHDFSATLRGRLVLCEGLAWAYMLHVLALSDKKLALLALHAGIGVVVCAWSYWENRRVRREIRYATISFAPSA